MTHYIYKGKEIRHTEFISLCRNNGINGGRSTHCDKLQELAARGNERAINILKELELKEC